MTKEVQSWQDMRGLTDGPPPVNSSIAQTQYIPESSDHCSALTTIIGAPQQQPLSGNTIIAPDIARNNRFSGITDGARMHNRTCGDGHIDRLVTHTSNPPGDHHGRTIDGIAHVGPVVRIEERPNLTTSQEAVPDMPPALLDPRVQQLLARLDLQLRDRATVATPQPTTSSFVKQTFPDGTLKSIVVPDSWKRQDKITAEGNLSTMSPSPSEDEAFLGVFDRVRLLNENTSQAFAKMLKTHVESQKETHKDSGFAKVLLPHEIRDLTTVMGASSVGDNQFSNHNPYPDPAAPIFNLASAQLITINGRAVLEVEGRFVDEDKKPLHHFRGIFIPSKEHDSVAEVFLQSPTARDFVRNEWVYRKALQSIEW